MGLELSRGAVERLGKELLLELGAKFPGHGLKRKKSGAGSLIAGALFFPVEAFCLCHWLSLWRGGRGSPTCCGGYRARPAGWAAGCYQR